MQPAERGGKGGAPRPETNGRELVRISPVLIEACVETVAGALAAEEGGAGRVELCADLEVGGLTPPVALVAECIRRLSIPVFVLVRPRGGAFVLDPDATRESLEQVARMKDIGASGIVAGALSPAGSVDLRALGALVSAAAPLPLTFHRAFDEIADQTAALESLIELGVGRVLTSGGAATATEGAGRLRLLHALAAGRIGILVAGGIRVHNVAALVQSTGVSEVHSRTAEDAEQVRALVTAARAGVSQSDGLPETAR
jgi:copper homeostasis protein